MTLFTRLPIWRWVNIPAKSYDSVVVFWPLTGWLTGGVTALAIYLLPQSWSMPVVVIIALLLRLLLTGALHEDGLADFCDAFGCGGDRDRILSIMKDSHIGTYGVIGLIFYFMLTVGLLSSMPKAFAALTVFACDPFAKLCASQLTNLLPYARSEGAKNKISYKHMGLEQLLWQIVFGVIPMLLLIRNYGIVFSFSIVVPIIVLIILIILMRRHIGGYTGDCCGATYLICELAMILSIYCISR